MKSHGQKIFFTSLNVQNNYFFDSKTKELEAKRVNFRLRRVLKWTSFQDLLQLQPPHHPPTLTQSFLTIKGLGDHGGTLANGISKINERECGLANAVFDEIVGSGGGAVRKYAEEIELVRVFTTLISPTAEICLAGKFKNTRLVFKMDVGTTQMHDDGVTAAATATDDDFLILELDETDYDFGKAFELEVETSRPEKAKILLQDMFRENGIQFSYSKRSKFGNLKAGSIL